MRRPAPSFLATAPYLLAERLHEPPSTYGLMILLPMAGYILGNASVARLSVFLASTRLFIVGLALSLASGVMLTTWCLADLTPWALFVPMALSSIGNGMSQPTGVAAGLSVYPRIAGAASGLMGFAQMIIAALGTLLLGLVAARQRAGDGGGRQRLFGARLCLRAAHSARTVASAASVSRCSAAQPDSKRILIGATDAASRLMCAGRDAGASNINRCPLEIKESHPEREH
jgi:MFS family permease